MASSSSVERPNAAGWNPFGPRMALARVTASSFEGAGNAFKITLGSTRLSEYTKISVLGKGTYGEVYKCHHKETG